MNFIVLQKEADGDLNLFDYVEFSRHQSVEKQVNFPAGDYIIVPASLGCYLQDLK